MIEARSSRGWLALAQRGARFGFCFLLVFTATWARSAPALEEIFDQTYPVSDDLALSVQNTYGTLYVYGAQPGQMRVIARKRAFSQARLDGLQVKVSIDGNKATIKTIFPPNPSGLSLSDRSGTVDYTIMIPDRSSVTRAELADGEIILQDLRGREASARLTNGRMIVRDCFCALDLAQTAGRIDAYYNWWEASRFAFAARLGSGQLRVQLPLNPAVRIDAACVDGNVRNDFANKAEGKTHARELRTTIGEQANAAEFTLRVERGNIDILQGK